MHLQTLDFVLAGVAAFVCAIGLFRGLSGFLAFLTASAATAAAAVWLWPESAAYIGSTVARVAAFAAGGVLVFGVVRMVVKKLVNGLLAQPVDSIAGLAVAVACCVLAVVAVSRFGIVRERSHVAREVARHVW